MLNVIIGSKYFIVQILLILVYFPIRYYYLDKSILNLNKWFGYTQEGILTSTFLLFIILRYKRFYTIEHFLTTFFMYGKLCVAMLILINKNYIILLYYVISCLFAWLLTKPTGYKGKSNLIDITDKQFTQIMNNTTNKTKGSYILLVAYAPFSETCYTVN